MKTTLLLVLFQSVLAWMSCAGQSPGQSGVYLTRYVISPASDVIGQVKVKTGAIQSVAIGGEHAGAFNVGKDQTLTVQKKKLGIGTWYDVTLTVTTEMGRQTAVFRIVKDEFVHNKVIAHRGAWKNTGAPENSIASLNHAAKLGCEGSEFDVHMSADSLPVICHDAHIQNLSIARTPASELLALRLSNSEPLPTLENYLKAGMEQNKMKLILEIKPSEIGKEASIALTRKIVALVERLHAQAWVDYISFDYDVCKEVNVLAPYANAAYLKGDKTPEELAADKLYGFDYHFSILQKNPTWVADAKRLNLTVNVWTVNEKPMLQDLLQQNVDFITTNEPEMLLEMVRK